MCQQGPNHLVPASQNQGSETCHTGCLQRVLNENTWARVKSFAEIQHTLDDRGTTEGLPFMPEMLNFCGRAFRVRKPANICLGGYRHLEGVWHLEGPRCSGSAHGGCQAKCLLYWHESWLEPAFAPSVEPSTDEGQRNAKELLRCFDATTNRYTCQLTEGGKLGSPMPIPSVREHLSSFLTGRITWPDVRMLFSWSYNRILFGLLRRLNWPANKKREISEDEIHVGDIVRVRSRASIVRSLNSRGFHKGLSLRPDMLRFSGRTFRVVARVDRIIDEYTGDLRRIKNGCYVLDGVTCGGEWKMCTREELYYWRSIWLEKIESEPASSQSAA